MNVGGWVLSACVSVCAPVAPCWCHCEGASGCVGPSEPLLMRARFISLLEWTVSVCFPGVCLCISQCMCVCVCVFLVVATAAQSWTVSEFLTAQVLEAGRWSGQGVREEAWARGVCVRSVCVRAEREETDGEREPGEERRRDGEEDEARRRGVCGSW